MRSRPLRYVDLETIFSLDEVIVYVDGEYVDDLDNLANQDELTAGQVAVLEAGAGEAVDPADDDELTLVWQDPGSDAEQRIESFRIDDEADVGDTA